MALRRNLRTFAVTAKDRVVGAVAVLLADPTREASVVQRVEHWADTEGDRPFVWFEGHTISYRELANRIARRSAVFAARGVRRGDSVALVMGNHPAFLVNVWAASRLGAVATLVNTHVTGAALRHALTSTSPKLFVAGREYVGAVRDALREQDREPPAVLWDETRPSELCPPVEPEEAPYELARLEAEHREVPPTVSTRGDELYVYIFTSGTTGLPKAGKISHARSMVAANGFGKYTLGLSKRDVLYVCLPLFHSSGFLIGAGGAAHTGATLALARKLSVSRFWDDVCDSGATAFVYIGEVCRYLLNAPAHPREQSHKLTRIVGNGMRPDVWKGFVQRFEPGIVHEFYGATEGNVNMTNLFGVEGSVGRMPPFPWMDNAFLAKWDADEEKPLRDERGLCVPCKPGEVGELLGRIDASRPTMKFEGYVGDAATSAKILRDVKEPGDQYFRSGDLLRKDRWGFYYFVDRIGDTFRWKGENVSTNEVGDVCGQFEEVELANVFGVLVPGTDGRAGMVALSLKPGAHFSPERFYEHVMKRLPSYAAPLFVRLLPEASMTATFKMRKVDLQNDGFDPSKVSDLLFVRDDQRRSYEPITPELYAELAVGRV
jgi:fatty-acyl-CoA synthase